MGQNENNIQIREIMEALTHIKVNQAKHELHQDRMNEILEKLTESVEYHIKRSDNLEELVSLFKQDSDTKLTAELEPIKSHINFIKGTAWALGIVAAVIMGLHQMGILQKLL